MPLEDISGRELEFQDNKTLNTLYYVTKKQHRIKIG